MNRLVTLLLLGVGLVVAFLGVRTILARYATLSTAALAVWNDPEVKKIRRRALKRLEKATKAAEKAARKAVKN